MERLSFSFILLGIILNVQVSIAAENSNQFTTKNLTEEGRSAFDVGSRYKISHVGNSAPRSLYNVDIADLDASVPALPQSGYSREVSIDATSQVPAARSSSYGLTYEKSAVIGLGDVCSGDYDCASIKNSARCVGGVCACDYSTAQLANLACLPRAKHLGDKCVLSEQCKNLDPLATCYQDTCMCEPIYHVAGDSGSPSTGPSSLGYGNRQGGSVGCLKKRNLGEPCTDTLQCAYKVYNSFCDARSRVCRCNFGFTPTGDDTCSPLAEALGQPCVVNAQCSNLMHATCGNSGTCQCEDSERYVAVQTAGSDRRKRQTVGVARLQMCLAAMDLGQSCMVSAQCRKRTRNADCLQGVCTCVNGFVQRDPYVNECLPLIKGIGLHSPPCTISAQCLQKSTFCNQTIDRCDCDAQNCNVGYKCLRKVWHEEPCENGCQCPSNQICKDGWCQCKKDACYSESAKRCLPRMLKFTANPYEFVARCCGDLSQNRCIGQVMLAMSFMNCSGTPVFTPTTLSGNPQITINSNGALLLSGSSTNSIMVSQNMPQQAQLTALQVTNTMTVTITARTSDGLTATTSVIIKPDACCTQAPIAATSTVTLMLAKIAYGPGEITNCVSGALGGIFNNVGNAQNLFYVPNLFSMPCGMTPVISATATASGFIALGTALATVAPNPMCTVNNGLLGFVGQIGLGAVAMNPQTAAATATCSVTAVATGCNGQVATSTVAFLLVCPFP